MAGDSQIVRVFFFGINKVELSGILSGKKPKLRVCETIADELHEFLVAKSKLLLLN